MSIVSRRIDGEAEERESALVAFVAERALRYGQKPNDVKAIERLGLSMGLKSVDAKRVIEKGEALAERVRAERLASKPAKMGFREEVAEFFTIVAEFLSPLLGFLGLIVLCMPYMFFEWLLEVRRGFSFAALGLTIAFWILLFVCLSVMPWKKLRPNREWLLAPIRFVRRQFRRLEAATRPE